MAGQMLILIFCRRGIAEEYIPHDVSNASQLVFPILDNGCVDANFNYTAPAKVGSSSRVSARRYTLPWTVALATLACITMW